MRPFLPRRKAKKPAAKKRSTASHERPSEILGKPLLLDRLNLEAVFGDSRRVIPVDTMVTTKGIFLDFGDGWKTVESFFGGFPVKAANHNDYYTHTGTKLVPADGKLYNLSDIGSPKNFVFRGDLGCTLLFAGGRTYVHVGSGKLILFDALDISTGQ